MAYELALALVLPGKVQKGAASNTRSFRQVLELNYLLSRTPRSPCP